LYVAQPPLHRQTQATCPEEARQVEKLENWNSGNLAPLPFRISDPQVFSCPPQVTAVTHGDTEGLLPARRSRSKSNAGFLARKAVTVVGLSCAY
jgi:hypothetical protein